MDHTKWNMWRGPTHVTVVIITILIGKCRVGVLTYLWESWIMCWQTVRGDARTVSERNAKIAIVRSQVRDGLCIPLSIHLQSFHKQINWQRRFQQSAECARYSPSSLATIIYV